MRRKVLAWLLICTSVLCLFCVCAFGSPTYEDFTTYTEVEPDDRIQKTANHIDFDCWRNETAMLYDDKEADHFDDFEHLVDAKMVSTPDDYAQGFFWALTNDVDDIFGIRDSSGTAIACYFEKRTGNTRRVNLLETHAGGWDTDYWQGAALGTMYYFKIYKSDLDLVCEIYDDADRTNLQDNLTVTLDADHKFRYMMACTTYNDTNELHMEIDIENLDLQEAVGETYNEYPEVTPKVSISYQRSLTAVREPTLIPKLSLSASRAWAVVRYLQITPKISLASFTEQTQVFEVFKQVIQKFNLNFERIVTFVREKTLQVKLSLASYVEQISAQVHNVFKDVQVKFSLSSVTIIGLWQVFSGLTLKLNLQSSVSHVVGAVAPTSGLAIVGLVIGLFALLVALRRNRRVRY